MALDDTLQILCTRCKVKFRDKARKVQPGYSRQCPGCEGVIYFEEGSCDANVQKALASAQQLRKIMRREEEDKVVAGMKAAPFVFGR